MAVRRHAILLVIAALATALALALIASLSDGGMGSSPAQAAPAAQKHRPHHARRLSTSTRHHTRTAQTAPGDDETNAPEPPGEPTPGHEDPAGQNIDHQCPPSCDTAAGEMP